jgi:signal transduction histidine kinase
MSADGRRILLIDDDEESLLITRAMLSGAGHTGFDLEWVSTYDAGLEVLGEGRHDACLLDYRLGARTGLELLREALAGGCRTPIIMLTGQGDHEIDLQAMKAGAADYLVKDALDPQRLERAIRYAVERRQLLDDLGRRTEELAQSNEQLQRLTGELRETAAAERRTHLELHQAHEDLKRTQAQLIQTEKLSALGLLVAGVAHELNNPLAFVSNNITILQRDSDAIRGVLELYRHGDAVLAERRPDLHKRIEAAAEEIDLAYTLADQGDLLNRSREGLRRIQRIVRDLCNFARLNESDVQEDCDLNGNIASILQLVRGTAEKHHVELEADFAPLPRVRGSPAKLNQMVLNLLVNAVQACDNGGRVTVRTRAGAEGVEVHVLDTGCGIAPAIRDKIFDPFFTTKCLGEGTGLGLSVSLGIVQEHGGRIEVESAPGRGAHFTVSLPLVPPTRTGGMPTPA